MDRASTPLVDFCVFKEHLIMKSRASSIEINDLTGILKI